MKARLLIIIGISLVSIASLVIFSVLDRYDDYLEQSEYETQRKHNEPKHGDKYYIEPERKTRLVEAEQDIRDKIRQLHEHNLQTGYAVNLNHDTQEIKIIVETEQFNDEIKAMLSQYPDVEFVFANDKVSLVDFGHILDSKGDKLESINTDGTFLGESLSYWKSLDFAQLREYRSQFDGNDFYYALGKMLATDFFEKELDAQNISYDGNLVVHSGNALQPDPPIIGYNVVVNATDNTIYVMNTSVNGNIVGKYFSMQELIFDRNVINAMSENKTVPFVNKFGESPTILVTTNNDYDDQIIPHQVIMDFNQTQSVMFVNNSTNTIIIQETGENKIDQIPDNIWRTKEVNPGETISVQFNATGYYELYVKKITDRIPGYLEHHASGRLAIFTENMTDYTFGDGLLMGRVFVQDVPKAEIPWQIMGAGNPRGLEIGIIQSVKDTLPGIEEYYKAKAKSLIPFEVNVIIK